MNNLKYRGKWVDNWFSNMALSDLEIDGRIYPSVENYYQSQKTIKLNEQIQFLECTPSESKKLGRKISLREDWEEIKEKVMEKALMTKFSKPEWKEQLLATGDQEIVEWNNWGDQIWGKTLDGVGENKLGKLLMKIREELK